MPCPTCEDYQSNSICLECDSFSSSEDLHENSCKFADNNDIIDSLSTLFDEWHIFQDVYFGQEDLHLPWSDIYWQLEISYLESNSKVWARLADDNSKVSLPPQQLC